MDGKPEEIHNILVALLSGKEEEIYNVLYKKKEIDDKTPKLRTEDEKKKLKSLSYKMRKFPKDLIDDIEKKFPFLQRTPKTAEQRKEQVKECHRQQRSGESNIEKEMRLKQKEYEHKRYTQSTEIRAKKVQEVREKRLAESEIDKDMRLKKQKEYNEKRSAQSDIDKEMRLNKQKEYDHEKRSVESEIEKERRLNKQKEYDHEKRSGESEIEKERRLNKQKEYDHEK